ncbi:MAG: hypothetical protein ACYCOU_13605 [Sulfobacillus sp.]
MHYLVHIIVPAQVVDQGPGAICSYVGELLAPYEESSGNPVVLYDWFAADGGRWCGSGREGPTRCAIARDSPDLPSMIISPDGIHSHRDPMTWEPAYLKDWEAYCRNILDRHSEDYLVGVDCHI